MRKSGKTDIGKPKNPPGKFLSFLLVFFLVATLAGYSTTFAPVSTTKTSFDSPGVALAAPGDDDDSGDSDEEEEGPYGPTDGCEIDEDKDYRVQLARPKDSSSGKSSGVKGIFTLYCPPESYYLTYVDTRSVMGTMSDAMSISGVSVFESAMKTQMNGVASWVFVQHAKLVGITVHLMTWAFHFDAVALFQDPVEKITKVLGNRVYKPLLGIVWTIVVGYCAYLAIARNSVAEAFGALLKSTVIGTLGLMTIKSPTAVVGFYNDTINSTTNWVYQLVEDIGTDPKKFDANNAPEYGESPDYVGGGGEGREYSEFSGVAANIWIQYVRKPWSRMQISNNNAGIAKQHAPELLKIRYADDRANYLCDLAGEECGGLFGDPDTSDDAGDDEDEDTDDTDSDDDTDPTDALGDD